MTDGSGAQTYRLTDGLGSTTDLCDGSGSVVVSYTYDAFGAVRSQSASNGNDWLFTGEPRDDESGFDFLRARYYDPALGRFLGLDPLGQGSNSYSYGLNNPTNMVDPTGMWTICSSWDSSYGLDTPACAFTQEVPYVDAGQVVWDVGQNVWVMAERASTWVIGDWFCEDSGCLSYLSEDVKLAILGENSDGWIVPDVMILCHRQDGCDADFGPSDFDFWAPMRSLIGDDKCRGGDFIALDLAVLSLALAPVSGGTSIAVGAVSTAWSAARFVGLC